MSAYRGHSSVKPNLTGAGAACVSFFVSGLKDFLKIKTFRQNMNNIGRFFIVSIVQVKLNVFLVLIKLNKTYYNPTLSIPNVINCIMIGPIIKAAILTTNPARIISALSILPEE